MKTIVSLVIALLLAPAIGSAADKLVIKGSDTLGAKFVPQLAEAFKTAGHQGVSFELAAEGSSTAFTSLIAGAADIGMSSREIKDKEKLEASSKGIELKETLAAWDLMAVIVNNANSVKNLTKEQVEGIFTGDITDWSEVGGKPGPISVYTRNTASGTYVDFQLMAMNKRDYASSAQKMAGNEQIAAEVGKNANGIGYVGLAYIKADGVAALQVGGVAPVAGEVHKYPFARKTYYYTVGEPKGLAKQFIEFALGPEGDKVAHQVGFIPVSEVK